MDESVVFGFKGDDDDVGWDKNLGVVDNGGQADDSNWLHDICESLERKCDEYNRSVSVSSDVEGSSKKCVEECEDDDDDDCVILDGDPDKAGVEGENVAVGDDSDELVVVGQKGKVACRDYPHPRELCANLPFTSTPHEQYCNQCHCYVCDAPAPCLKWGTGISIDDHCHATGKEEFWNQQRESLRKSHQSTVPVPEVQFVPTNQAPASTPQMPYNIPPAQGPVSAPIPSIQYQTSQTQVPMPAPNTNMQYQAFQAQTSRPALVWPSRTEAMNMPSIRGQSYVVPRNNLQLSLALLQSRNTGNNALASNRRNNVGSLGPRVNVPPVFKRSGTPGVASASNQRTGYLINGHGSTVYTRVPNAVLAPDSYNNMISAQRNGNSNMYLPSLQPYMQPMPSNMMAFQSQPQSHLFSQSSVATTSSNRVPTRPMLPDLSSSRGNFSVYSTSQPQIPFQNSYVGEMSSRPVLPQPQVSLQPTLPDSSGTTVPYEPPVSSQPNHASNSQQNVFQQQNQTNNFGDTGFSDIGLNWLANTTNPSSQQTQAQNSQVTAPGSFDEFDSFFSGRSAFNMILNPWMLNSEELATISSESSSATVDGGTLFNE